MTNILKVVVVRIIKCRYGAEYLARLLQNVVTVCAHVHDGQYSCEWNRLSTKLATPIDVLLSDQFT